MKKSLRIMRLLFVISLIITLSFISTTYSKYQEAVSASYTSKMLGWNIKLNNEEIHNKTELVDFVEPIIGGYDENNGGINNNLENVIGEGLFAPGIIGYLLFIIDYREVDVNFRATFEIEPQNEIQLYYFNGTRYSTGLIPTGKENEIINEAGFKVMSYEDGRYIFFEDIDFTEAPKYRYIKVYFSWKDDITVRDKKDAELSDGNKVDKNLYDTDYALNLADNTLDPTTNVDKSIAYKVKVTFEQKEQ